jgi:colanic acid/amylovoran biosynthesis glycosyltransferase
MRIAVYAQTFVRPTETFIYETTKGLAAAGHDVTVYTRDRECESERPFDPVVTVPLPGRWDPFHVVRRALRPVLGDAAGSEKLAIVRDRMTKALERARPDVILANYGPGGVFVAPIAQRLGVPFLTSFHGVDASRHLRIPEWRRRYETLFGQAAGITGPSEYVRRRLIEAGSPPERTHVLHYGIPTDRIAFCPPGARYDGGPVRFLFVGRMTPKKAPVTLLRSFAVAREELGDVGATLTLLGDGPLWDEVAAERDRLGLGDAVDLRGRVTHDEVISAFQHAHIYVQHSVTAKNGDEEGLPVSITEALAGGLPVVATRHSGIPEVVINDRTGYLVDEGDIDGMGAAMARLARNPGNWDEFGRAGRDLLEAEFRTDLVQARLQALLSDAVAAARRAA